MGLKWDIEKVVELGEGVAGKVSCSLGDTFRVGLDTENATIQSTGQMLVKRRALKSLEGGNETTALSLSAQNNYE